MVKTDKYFVDRLITKQEIVVDLRLKTIQKKPKRTRQPTPKHRAMRAAPVAQTLQAINEEDDDIKEIVMDEEDDQLENIPQEDGANDRLQVNEQKSRKQVVLQKKRSHPVCAERRSVNKDLQSQ